VREGFFDHNEDSVSHNSLIGSKKNLSCDNTFSSPSMLSHDTKTSKGLEKANSHNFHIENLNHEFLSKPDFEGLGAMLRRNLKKIKTI
jgi:hypothetical protein